MKLGDKEVKDFGLPYLIAEVGANHNGDMDLAKKMIDSAKSCGCDAVKFQSWNPDSLIAQEEYDRNQQYNDSPKKHFGSLREMVEKYYLRHDQHIELKEYCDKAEITFFSTPFSIEEVDFLEELKVPFYKIASMDINNLLFLKHIAKKNKPIIISTGMATLAEIENAIKTIEREGNCQIILLHCISIYPPAYEDIHLNNIPMLRQTFGYPTGFSDHTIGISIPLASVALGTCMIEKHFTLNKELPGWDHEVSANPDEMRIIVEESRNIVKSLGRYRRIVGKSEEEKKLKFRRSIVVKKDLKQGHILTADDLDFKRPGTDIRPDEAQYVIGRKLKHDFKNNELIHWNDMY
ncbi:N-acetylneuraminate synthase family protein [Desulfonema magnum]|uniref:Polysaccharide biosynthesis protein n=1 Tax=Desulfonema magnum TaxID=45655 RepID=A0A975BZH4_9BACT|nr:N-acetylneuraminate synthase family protein [Desulfonema magnum]QTA93609.1 Polysaccharide biosynthesis protein [Desulfonema magnum]